MKLMLTGPQALTIFTIAKDEQVPASAKTSSFATPQGYYCTETNKLHLFIKGNEYCFIDMEEHERVVTVHENIPALLVKKTVNSRKDSVK